MSWRGALPEVLRRLLPRAVVRGQLDGLDGLVLRGWGAGWRDRRVSVSLQWHGRPLPVEFERESRPDVVRALQVKVARRYGFRLFFGPAYWRTYGAPGALPEGATFDLLLDGHRFGRVAAPHRATLDAWFADVAAAARQGRADEERTLLALAIAAALGGTSASGLPPEVARWLDEAATRRGLREALDTGDAAGALAAARATRAWLDSTSPLAWQGWACAGDDAIELFTVTCNGARLPVSPHRLPRTDVADKLGVTRVSLGFACAVPPGIWRHADVAGGCELALLVGGRAVDGTAHRFDAEALRRAIDDTLPGPDAPPIETWPATRLAAVDAALDRLAAHARAASAAGWLDAARRDAVLDARARVDALVSARGLRLSEPGSLRFNLDSTEELTFAGWACDVVANDEVFELTCDGEPVDAPVQRISRGDVQEALKETRTDLGFAMPLPVSLWHRAASLAGDDAGAAPRSQPMRLALAVNGLPVVEDFRLDTQVLAAALVRASRALAAGPTVDAASRFNRARWLHLLAHAEAAGGLEGLGEAARAAVEAARARLRISDRLDASAEDAAAPARATGAAPGEPPVEPDTPERRLARRVARWQKQLNRDLATMAPAAALDRLLEVGAREPRARDHLLLHLAPWACGHGLFDRVKALVGTDVARHFAEGGNVWHRTLLLPFLVDDGAFGEAATMLADVAARTAPGWINTECVAHAVRRAIDAPAAATASATDRAASATDRAALLTAFVALLDALRVDAWSRLTDAWLRRAIVAAVTARDLPGGAELVTALDRVAVQAFALQPAFWREVEASNLAASPATALRPALAQAREAALVARAAVDALSTRAPASTPRAASASLRGAVPALERLHGAGVSDAAAWIRELALAALRLAPGDEALAREACAWLAAVDAADPWRVIASPWGVHDDAVPADVRVAAARAATAWPEAPWRAAYDAARAAAVEARRAAPVTTDADPGAVQARWKALKPLLAPRHEAVGLLLAVDLLNALGAPSAGDADPVEATRLAIQASLRGLAQEAAHRASAGLAPAASLMAVLAPGESSAGAAKHPARTALRRQLLDTLSPSISARLADAGTGAAAGTGTGTGTGTTQAHRASTAGRAAGLRLAIDLRESEGRRHADALAQAGFAVVALVDEGRAAEDTGPYPHVTVADDPVQRLRDLAAWVLAEDDAMSVAVLPGDAEPRVEVLEGLVPHLHHYTGWPARRRARTPRAGERLAGAAARVDVADRGTGFALSRYALAAWLEASEPADEAPATFEELAFRRLGADDRLAETLARVGVSLAPAPRFVAPRGWLDAATPKLWPTWGPVRAETLAGSNQLVLRGARERVARIDAAPVVVVAVARNEREMLPHFLSHYRRLGADAFVIVDNGSDDGSIELLAAQPDVLLYEADTQYRQSHYGVAWQQAVLAAHAQGKWALVADIDEMLVWPGCETQGLAALCAALDAQGATAAEVLMVDMYPRGGLAGARLDEHDPFAVAPLFDDPPLVRWRLGSGYHSSGSTWLSGLRHRLIPDAPPNAFTSQKIALLRHAPWVRLAEGLHYASGLDVAPRSLFFAHFKYHARFLEKVEDEIRRMQHFDDAAEYRQYLGMREAATRGFEVAGVSAAWRGGDTWAPLAVRDDEAQG